MNPSESGRDKGAPDLLKQALDWASNLEAPSVGKVSRTAFLAFLATLAVDGAALAQDADDDDDSAPVEDPFAVTGEDPFASGVEGDPFVTGTGVDPFASSGADPFAEPLEGTAAGDDPFADLPPAKPGEPKKAGETDETGDDEKPTEDPFAEDLPTATPVQVPAEPEPLAPADNPLDPRSVRPSESGFSDRELAALYMRVAPSVVRLHIEYESGKQSRCSGYFFGQEGIVATARHCVDNTSTNHETGTTQPDNVKLVWVEWPHEIDAQGEISEVAMAVGFPVGRDTQNDMAFLVTPAGIDTPAPLMPRTQPIRRTTSVVGFGHPEGMDWMTSPGRVLSTVDGMIKTNTNNGKGGSGGPVVDGFGSLVGTHVYGDDTGLEISHEVPADVTWDLYQGFLQAGTFRDAQLKLGLQAVYHCPITRSFKDDLAVGQQYREERSCTQQAVSSMPTLVWEAFERMLQGEE